MLTKREKAKILELGRRYVGAREVASTAEGARKDLGSTLIKALRDAGKKKIVGLVPDRNGVVDGARILVGYGVRPRYLFDSERMFALLKRHNLVERVAKVVIDENALADLLGDETVDAKVLEDLAGLIRKVEIRYPIVKEGKV